MFFKKIPKKYVFEKKIEKSKNLKKINDFLKIFDFSKKNIEQNIFRKNFQKTFSIKFFQYFLMIFFANHISSSRRTREKIFQTLLDHTTEMAGVNAKYIFMKSGAARNHDFLLPVKKNC